MLRAAYQPAIVDRSSPRDRAVAAAIAAAVQALLLYVVISGLAVGVPQVVRDDLKLFGVSAPPPPPVEKPVLRHATSRRTEGAASPPNLRAKATEIVAPPPVIAPPAPPPVVAAPVPGMGSDRSAGAAPVAGPGSGSGGQGNGTGSGGAGDGDGDGDGTPLQLKSGRIKDSDYPRSAWEAGIGGTVYTRFIVGTNGRVTSCVVVKSSGNTEIDATTCRVIMQRFRYEPTRDAQGRAIPDEVDGEHEWIAPRPPADDQR